MSKRFLLVTFCLMALSATPSMADDLPPLHVEGKNLVDASGTKVTLHGVMDTPNRYFNGWRWQNWKPGYGNEDVQPCLNYFEQLFTAISDHSQGAYCDVFRLHMDPCWTNDPNKQSDGKASGEADISMFSLQRYKRFLTSLYLPLVKRALNHGIYVVVRPPGVCPSPLKVGDDYCKYLVTVWKEFASNSFVKQHSGQISIELANEPVDVRMADGTSSNKALRDFFQPVVDSIRSTGFDGIIWVPGAGWQSQYGDYAANPIVDNNFGYAVHCYPGWYGSGSNDGDNTNANTMMREFTRMVPVVKTNPIIVTEIDWSPSKPGTDHLDEHGNVVLSNYGTWGTATTSHFGRAFKYIHDTYGNISMTLGGTGEYIDIDEYRKSGTVHPAFEGVAEACGEACFAWYKEWWDQKNGIGTSVASVSRDEEQGETEYYTISGVRCNKPARGIYIERKGSKAKIKICRP